LPVDVADESSGVVGVVAAVVLFAVAGVAGAAAGVAGVVTVVVLAGVDGGAVGGGTVSVPFFSLFLSGVSILFLAAGVAVGSVGALLGDFAMIGVLGGSLASGGIDVGNGEPGEPKYDCSFV